MLKCIGALSLMRKILKRKDSKVYVHCSAGMYRSPQIVILYLTILEGYLPEDAIKLVR